MSRKSKIFTIIATAGGVIFGSLVILYLMGRFTIRIDSDLVRYHVIIGELQEILSTLKDAETGQRGYLLTGKDDYLIPHDRAVARIHQEFETLEARARAGELSVSDVDELWKLSSQKLDELHKTIFLRRTQGLPAALAAVETDIGKNKMDLIRALVAKMTTNEEAALANARRKADALVYERNLLFVLSTLLNLAVLAWAYRRIREETEGRERGARNIAAKGTTGGNAREYRRRGDCHRYRGTDNVFESGCRKADRLEIVGSAETALLKGIQHHKRKLPRNGREPGR
jgi:CHASE3 domain sensor protein